MSDAFQGTSRFQIAAQIGRGGMGVVYRAFDAERGVDVALKTLPRLDGGAVFRFKQEFRVLADVAHPNLVRYHELFHDEASGRWFFTMELLEGGDFFAYTRRAEGPTFDKDAVTFADAMTVASYDLVAPADEETLRKDAPPTPVRQHALDVERLVKTVKQLVGAVSAVHAAGLLHRDIKPSNALVTPSGRLVLLDFGLARDADASSADRDLAGTPGYMAPEQIAGLGATEASDWYAVGVVLFEALTGRLPYVGSVVSILAEKQTSDAPSARLLAPEAPDVLSQLADDLLARDPAARPSGADIARRLDLEDAAVARDPRAAFLGRDDALAKLEDALLHAARGNAVAARVFGPSGVGKSALIGRFTASAARRGAIVLAGRCYEQESVPYKALDSLIDELSSMLTSLAPADLAPLVPADAAELARVFPVLKRVPAFAEVTESIATNAPLVDDVELRRRAFRALQDLFTRLSRRAPVVLVIDDLQWGDLDSARLLVDLMTPGLGDPARLLAIGAYRSEEAAIAASPMLGELDRAHDEGRLGDVRDVPLDLLSEEDACALALALLGGEDASRPEARRIAHESLGSPFFVGELVRFGAARGGSHASLSDIVLARVGSLPADARRLLEVVAIAGQPTAQRLIVEAAIATTTASAHGSTWPMTLDAAAAFATLRAANLVRSYGVLGGDAVEAYHDRIREAVKGRVDGAARQLIHAALAHALTADGRADPERLAAHHEAAGDPARAVACMRVAADSAAAALAFDRAARLYRRVLALDPRAKDRRRIVRRLGEVLVSSGRGAEGARALLDAVGGASAPEARELRRLAAEHILVSGRLDDGLAILRDVLAELDLELPKTPARALASFLFRAGELRIRGLEFQPREATVIDPRELARVDACFSASNGLTFSDPVRGAYFQALHLLLALRAGEPRRVALGLANYGAHVATEGVSTAARAAGVIDRAQALATRLGDPRALGRAAMARGTAAFLVGRFRPALASLSEAERVFLGMSGVSFELGGTHLWMRLALFFVGDLLELRRRADAHFRAAEARGDLFVEATIAASSFAITYLRANDPVGARRAVQHALGRWTAAGFHVLHFVAMWHEALAALYAGDGEGAREILTSRWGSAERALLLRIQVCAVTLHHLRGAASIAAALHGRRDGVREAERDIAMLSKQGMPSATAYADLLRAGASAARGDATEKTSALLDAAARGFDAVDMRLHAAVARRHAAGIAKDMAGVAQADALLAAEGITRPDRWAAMIAPGFYR